MYCVYVTTYLGDKMPSKYVGSTSIKRILGGYRGSVSSKEFSSVWNLELQENPNLFVTEIVSKHDTRENALREELKFQIDNGVVSSDDWINKSLSIPNGFFGMDVSGSKNPMYGKTRKGEKHKGGENISAALHRFFKSEKSENHRLQSKKRMSQNNPSKRIDVLEKSKEKWVANNRNVGNKNGMFGKQSPMRGKKLYNNGSMTKSFNENEQPNGWVIGRHR